MRLFLMLFCIIPLIEIVLFIQIGGEIGALATLVWLALAALVGINLIRLQGMATVLRTREMLARGEAPEQALAEGLLLVVGGVLLIIPGFASDLIALLLIIPPLRKTWVRRWLRKATVTTAFHGNVYDASPERPAVTRDEIPSRPGQTIEGEYRRDD